MGGWGSASLLPPAPAGLTGTAWLRIHCLAPDSLRIHPQARRPPSQEETRLEMGQGAEDIAQLLCSKGKAAASAARAFDARPFADGTRPPLGPFSPRAGPCSVTRAARSARLSLSPSPTLGAVPAAEVVAFAVEL